MKKAYPAGQPGQFSAFAGIQNGALTRKEKEALACARQKEQHRQADEKQEVSATPIIQAGLRQTKRQIDRADDLSSAMRWGSFFPESQAAFKTFNVAPKPQKR